MALQYRQQSGEPQRTRFVAFADGYHGDTLGAASLGGVGRFFDRFRSHGYECGHVRTLEELRGLDARSIAAVVIEPLIQGVNEMRPWPAGMLAELREWCDDSGVHLILDEVMTGFGRTGTMFACQRESVIPDFLCLAKGLTGGTLPLAATLTTDAVYQAFLGAPERAFYYGHSYTANPPGCAAALASLRVFADERVLEHLPAKIDRLRAGLAALEAAHPLIHEVRQCGLIAGIELRQADGTKFPTERRTGEAVCLTARAHGLLTRPILDTIVLMPPLCATLEEINAALAALNAAISAGVE
jgi:adenosylmethionine-8-amino-7-oxononanoate aminotransferase